MIRLNAFDSSNGPISEGIHMTTKRKSLTVLVATILAALGLSGVFAGQAAAVTYDPSLCTDQVTFDPSIPTPESVFGTTLAPNTGGSNALNNAAKKNTNILYPYLDALANAAPSMVLKRSAGTTALGRDIPFVIISSPSNIADLEDDAAFWRSVREGEISPVEAKKAVTSRPAFAWISSNVHGDEASSGEATIKLAYELAARRDCANYKRLTDLTSFLLPVQNPDGRDAYQRTSAWLFDLNRDWHTQEQVENYLKMSAALEYPSVVYVDAHQQGGSSFFFPPNEDPVHAEISDASMNAINSTYGPALQKRFNDQNISYNNYSSYDLFTPEYGDTAPSLLLGAAGMTYEKGRGGTYAKQVYDHYLSLDETLNTTSRLKTKILGAWVDQWYEAIQQGANGELEPNQIVSPSHSIVWDVPAEKVYGYFYKPNNHDGDAAKMISVLQRAGVKVYRLEKDTAVNGLHVFGDMTVNDLSDLGPGRQTPNAGPGTLPAGTLYIPMAQSMKHWLQAVLGEDPFVPYPYFYDVTGWSFSELKGMSGNGYLMQPMPADAAMSLIGSPDLGGAPDQAAPYYAFNTDSSRALIMLYKLADEGVTAYRTAASFSAGGVTYPTGAAILDGASVTAEGVDLESYSDTYQTPIAGMSSLPSVSRYEIDEPKLGVLTGNAAVTLPPDGICNAGTTVCQAIFTMREKMDLPVEPVTTTDLAAGKLTNDGFTAVVNPATTVAAGAGATALQQFVNAGGSYFSWGTGGATSARNAGMTNVNTTTNGTRDGVPVEVAFDTDSPLSWGFDNGGFLYRTSSAVTFDPATLAGNGGTIPDATEAISYPNPTLRFSYATANDMTNLNGKTAAADQPFGAGRVTLLSVDPTFRAWLEGAERLILNGVLYPKGSAITPPAARGPQTSPNEVAPGTGDKLPQGQLPKVKSRPAKAFHDPNRDLRVMVKRADAKKLKRIFRAVAPKKFKRVAKFKGNRRRVTLIVRNAASVDGHNKAWVSRLQARMGKRGISPLRANY
ncbi:MAG: hypothetical protein J0H98_07725 [Solirubrobacterales bacterium]|nr:hypothetical protein [Solirubrobacterales bacterium]